MYKHAGMAEPLTLGQQFIEGAQWQGNSFGLCKVLVKRLPRALLPLGSAPVAAVEVV